MYLKVSPCDRRQPSSQRHGPSPTGSAVMRMHAPDGMASHSGCARLWSLCAAPHTAVSPIHSQSWHFGPKLPVAALFLHQSSSESTNCLPMLAVQNLAAIAAPPVEAHADGSISMMPPDDPTTVPSSEDGDAGAPRSDPRGPEQPPANLMSTSQPLLLSMPSPLQVCSHHEL